MILACDPGSTQSAYVVYDPKTKTVREHAIVPNEKMRSILNGIMGRTGTTLVIEYMRPRGMPTSKEEMDTMFELGRMVEHWFGEWVKVYRGDVKLALCGNVRAKDANIRQALIDMFGGKQETKKGGKLYKVKGDEWSALALSVVYAMKQRGGGHPE